MDMHGSHRFWLVALGLCVACKGDKKAENSEESTGAEHAGPVSCGAATCPEGQICCNPSCGICTPPDGMCTQQFCDGPPSPSSDESSAAPTTTCDNVRCMAGTHCEMIPVQCIKAPCPPVPECKPDADAGS